MKSVTKILGRMFPMNPNIPKHILENARLRGVAVHEWIEEYNKYLTEGGELPVINLEYQIYADYYKQWIEDYQVTPIKTELKMSSDDGIVGIVDLICKDKDDNVVVVDFKITYSYDLPYVELQTSAYKRLALRNNVIDSSSTQKLLHLSKNGYSYVELDYRWDLFEKIMEIDKYMDERKKK